MYKAGVFKLIYCSFITHIQDSKLVLDKLLWGDLRYKISFYHVSKTKKQLWKAYWELKTSIRVSITYWKSMEYLRKIENFHITYWRRLRNSIKYWMSIEDFHQILEDYWEVLRAFYIILKAEMEYCASAASMLAGEIWQIAEGFVEVLWKYVGSIEEMWEKCSKWSKI